MLDAGYWMLERRRNIRSPNAKERGCLPGGTGCYSATLSCPLVRNGDPGCYTGCYKVQHRVLHFRKSNVLGLKSKVGRRKIGGLNFRTIESVSGYALPTCLTAFTI